MANRPGPGELQQRACPLTALGPEAPDRLHGAGIKVSRWQLRAGLPYGLFSFRWPGTLGLWSRHSSLFPGSHRASPRLCAKSLRTPVTALRVHSDNQGHLPTLRSSAQSHPQSPFLQVGSQHRFWDKDPTSLGHSHPTQVGHGCCCRKGLAVPSSDPAQFGEQVTFQP